MEDKQYVGTIVNFHDNKGFGFVREWTESKHPREFFFHKSGMVEKFTPVVSDSILFRLKLNPRRLGQIMATQIELIKRGDPTTENIIREALGAALGGAR